MGEGQGSWEGAGRREAAAGREGAEAPALRSQPRRACRRRATRRRRQRGARPCGRGARARRSSTRAWTGFAAACRRRRCAPAGREREGCGKGRGHTLAAMAARRGEVDLRRVMLAGEGGGWRRRWQRRGGGRRGRWGKGRGSGAVRRLELVYTQRAAVFARRQQRPARPHLCGGEVGAVPAAGDAADVQPSGRLSPLRGWGEALPEGDGERRRLEGVAAGSDARHARDAYRR